MELYLNAIILGIVEGITEFLPVSSTGHLLITEFFLNCRQNDSFNVLIQIGPIIAATLVFHKHIAGLITGLGKPETRDELYKLTACFVLTCVGGFTAKKLGLELPDTLMPIAVATLIGGMAILWIEGRTKGKAMSEAITWPVAIAVAAAQILAAVFPGTSRSGAAVMAALVIGLSRPAAVRFSFLVGIPTMFAAGALQLKETIDVGGTAVLLAPDAILAFIVATVTAWITVVWLLNYVQRNTFVPFAWYRIILGVALVVLAGMKIL